MKPAHAILILALLLCLFPMPYGYFILVRCLTMAVFAVMAYHYYKAENHAMIGLCVVVLLLFQPFFKIPLGREIWNIVDVIVAIGLAVILWRGRTVEDIDSKHAGIKNTFHPIYYQTVYTRNLATDDIRDKQGNLLTSASMLLVMPYVIKFEDGSTNDLIERAKTEYLALAKQGYPDAYNNLAVIEDFYHGGSQAMYRKGAEAGSINSLFNLSIVTKGQEAFSWNKKAIEKIKNPTDNIEIMLLINMAIRYHCGYGCEANIQKAKELYDKVLLYRSSNIAENNLGAILLEEGHADQAKRLFNQAAVERNHYQPGIDAGEVVSMALQNLKALS